jgi:uncharacterized protein YndB with AHSA1/START domain
MSTVHASIQIEAPIERVWETIMDPNQLADWVTIHKSVSDVSDAPLHEGSTMRQAISVRGVTFRVHWTLVALGAPRHAEWNGVGPAHSEAVIRYELASDDEGHTTFDYTNQFQPPGGRLGNAAGRLIVGATSEREANNSLSRLKALLESK